MSGFLLNIPHLAVRQQKNRFSGFLEGGVSLRDPATARACWPHPCEQLSLCNNWPLGNSVPSARSLCILLGGGTQCRPWAVHGASRAAGAAFCAALNGGRGDMLRAGVVNWLVDLSCRSQQLQAAQNATVVAPLMPR